jgi:hypothetical protein
MATVDQKVSSALHRMAKVAMPRFSREAFLYGLIVGALKVRWKQDPDRGMSWNEFHRFIEDVFPNELAEIKQLLVAEPKIKLRDSSMESFKWLLGNDKKGGE